MLNARYSSQLVDPCFRRIRSRHESGVRHEKVYPWPSHSNWRCSGTDQLGASTARNRPMGAALRRKFGAPLPCHTGGASPENTGSIPAQKADQSRGSRSRNYGLTIRTFAPFLTVWLAARRRVFLDNASRRNVRY